MNTGAPSAAWPKNRKGLWVGCFGRTWQTFESLADRLADVIDDESPAWITYMTPEAAVISVLQPA